MGTHIRDGGVAKVTGLTLWSMSFYFRVQKNCAGHHPHACVVQINASRAALPASTPCYRRRFPIPRLMLPVSDEHALCPDICPLHR
jgi:hypothetical protein